MPGRKVSSRQTQHMADGFNETRAIRVTEVMNDFQLLLRHIMQPQPDPPAGQPYEEGYELMRQCRREAQAVLDASYDYDLLHVPSQSGEQEKRQLQRVLLDASARRHQAQKIYLRIVAALRWVNAIKQILQMQSTVSARSSAIQQTHMALRMELASITDERAMNELRTKDIQAGHWLQEDPPLAIVLNWIRHH